jgi:hypothetical protein
MPACRSVSLAIRSVLALVCAALVLASSAPLAGGATTGHAYAGPGPATHLSVVGGSIAERRTDRPAFVPPAGRSYGYGAVVQLARPSAHRVSESFAPQMTRCGLPVFMPGRDTPETTAHIVDALGSNPSWSVLTRAEHPASTTNRQWYQGDPRCAGSVGDGLSCDEFPFFKTFQGGPGASLRQVPDSENLPQARAISAFYRSCGIAVGSNFVVSPQPNQPTTTWTC